MPALLNVSIQFLSVSGGFTVESYNHNLAINVSFLFSSILMNLQF